MLLKQIKNPYWHVGLNDDECLYEDATIFLQGSCQLFAYARNERFGYGVWEIRHSDDGSNHTFCKTEISGTSFYIDIRGATTNRDDFINGTNYCSASNHTEREVHKDEMHEELTKPGECFGYAFARHIIKSYPKCYDVRLIGEKIRRSH